MENEEQNQSYKMIYLNFVLQKFTYMRQVLESYIPTLYRKKICVFMGTVAQLYTIVITQWRPNQEMIVLFIFVFEIASKLTNCEDNNCTHYK